MPDRPPLALDCEITTADGTRHLWGSYLPTVGDRPTGLGFRTRRGDGFADAQLTLRRPIDRDYPDLGLLDELILFGHQGDVAYEGRVTHLPRSIGDGGHSIDVAAAGWMAETRRRKAREIYVDRDLSRWRPESVGRRAQKISANFPPQQMDVVPDVDGGGAGIRLSITGAWAAPTKPEAEAWYDAGTGRRAAVLYHQIANSASINTGDALWNWRTSSEPTDAQHTGFEIVNRPLTTGVYYSPATARRYLFIDVYYDGTPAGEQGTLYEQTWKRLAVYGDHGLALIGPTDPKGVAASAVIRHLLAKYCPKLRADGVQETTYPIAQLVVDADVFDAIAQANAFHRWSLGCWENRTVHYAPVDLTDFDWQVRLDDPGVTTTLQGDSIEHLANGIEVSFDNVQTGERDLVGPDDSSLLSDPSVENPANRHGDDIRTTLELSHPATKDDAIELGRVALAEFNQPRGIGEINVRGHIRDRQGNWQPVWKVRADDRIAITSSTSLSDRPRLIGETSYQHDGHRLTVAVDSTLPRLDAVLDRVGTALQAENLLNA